MRSGCPPQTPENVKHNPGGGGIMDLQRYVYFIVMVTLQETKISHLEKRNIIFMPSKGDM